MTHFNFYGDESCHLHHDVSKWMVLGAVWGSTESTRQVAQRIRQLKVRHGLNPWTEIKWTKVSPSLLDLYLDLIGFFFDSSELHFRAIIADKSVLDHESRGQTHDDWYYKMWFHVFAPLLTRSDTYSIYLDHKDAYSQNKADYLHDVLCNKIHDFNKRSLVRVQVVRSHQVEQIQLCDLLVGAIAYANRGLETSATKLALVEAIKQASGYDLKRATLLGERKLNIFAWDGT